MVATARNHSGMQHSSLPESVSNAPSAASWLTPDLSSALRCLRLMSRATSLAFVGQGGTTLGTCPWGIFLFPYADLPRTCSDDMTGTVMTDKGQRRLCRVGDHRPREAVERLFGPQTLTSVYAVGLPLGHLGL